jgi:hypothetical protein
MICILFILLWQSSACKADDKLFFKCKTVNDIYGSPSSPLLGQVFN